MTTEQIQEVVSLTLDELIKRKLLNVDSYQTVLERVEKLLRLHFTNRGDGTDIGYALHQLSDDPYIDVLYLQYRDGKTLEFIAEVLDKDVSTVKRNKKRLILTIYKMLE